MTERHRVAYRLRTAAEGPDGTEQWWTVGQCRQRRVCILRAVYSAFESTLISSIVSYRSGPRTDPWGTPTVHGVTADECEHMRTDCVLPLR